ncbi:armadillo repeat-containing protein [Dictyostelium discoideum AX4]|uniref:Armadillo repeat-containing protein n=1 Tax=Dictyostelium discoideum TaxID=44689 RepID=Q86HD4_DICDI|nr:armadillo repeat-containing protein [Dictyostelium discoideum AX4]EAL69160.1 armadillo repeat-containing protein [Dictyostelium discoideum AX4]|eukprot:XP_643103.1 armadillo repeat-containing protein [Dictyostelium discoideum AX4]
MGKFTSSKKTYRVDPLGLNLPNNGFDNEELDTADNLSGIVAGGVVGATTDGNLIMNEDLSQSITDPIKLLDLISSSETVERDFAFRTISEFVLENESFTQELIKPENIRKIITRLVEPDVQIRVSVIGTFRNLTVVKEDICETLINLDILTPLLSNFVQGINFIKTLNEKDMKQQKSIETQHVLIQAVALINNLCEVSDKGFSIVSKECKSILTTLFEVLINNSIFMPELIMNISEFLTVVTDDNNELNATINNELMLQLFNIIKDSTTMNIRLKTLISTIILNIGQLYNKELVIQNITPILLSTFQFNSISTLNSDLLKSLNSAKDAKLKYDQLVAEQTDDNNNNNNDEKMGMDENSNNNNNDNNIEEPIDESKPITSTVDETIKKTPKNIIKNAAADLVQECEKQFKNQNEEWKDSLLAQQSAIELFVNIVSDAQQQQPDDSNPYDDDDDKFLDIEDGETEQSQQILSNISKFIISTPLCQYLIELLNSIVNFDSTEFGKLNIELLPNISSIRILQKRAMTCLSNLLITFIPKEENVQKILWDLLMKIANKSFTTNDIDIIEMTTSSLWSIMRTNSNIGFTTEIEIKNLVELAIKSPNSIKTNLIGIIGIAGQKPYCQNILKEVAMFLLQCLNKDLPADIISESLNSIFDIYAEPNVNNIVKEVSLIQHLDAFVPIIRNKIKTDKKKLDRALLDRLDESRINLSRFITYKKSQK